MAAYAWALFVSSQSNSEDSPTWVEVAHAGNVLSLPSSQFAELTAACEATRAALAFWRGSLRVDAATGLVID